MLPKVPYLISIVSRWKLVQLGLDEQYKKLNEVKRAASSGGGGGGLGGGLGVPGPRAASVAAVSTVSSSDDGLSSTGRGGSSSNQVLNRILLESVCGELKLIFLISGLPRRGRPLPVGQSHIAEQSALLHQVS